MVQITNVRMDAPLGMKVTAMSAEAALDPIAQDIWEMKYRFASEDGSIEDTWRRVARAVAQAEAPEERARWAEAFESILAGYRFLPAGRILSGAGTGRAV